MDGAEAAYRTAIEADPGPGPAVAHYNLGLLLQDVRKNVDGAEWAYRAAIEADLASVRPVDSGSLGLSEVEWGYDAAIKPDARYFDVYFAFGSLLEKEREDIKGAEAAYREAIKADPGHTLAHCALGTLLWHNRYGHHTLL